MASKSKKRRRVLGASCILAALIIAGSSFAWFTSKDEVTNRLTANADYGVSIVESFVPPKNWLPGQEINKDVYAVNTGTVEAFVKEDISGVLNYTYETTVDELDLDNCVTLDDKTVLAIDGATTEEAGGFLAWTNAIDSATGERYDADSINSRRKDADNPTDTGTEDPRWTPPASGTYIFRRAIDTKTGYSYTDPTSGETVTTPSFEYAGYYYDKDSNKYYKIVIVPDTYPTDGQDGVNVDAPYAQWNFDMSVGTATLNKPVDEDGRILADPSIKYVVEHKVENKDANLHFVDGENGANAYLLATYTDNASFQQNVDDKRLAYEQATAEVNRQKQLKLEDDAKVAQAQAALENAQGAYNTAYSRYYQTKDNYEYAKALATATNALYDAADARAKVQKEKAEADKARDDAWTAIKNKAEGMQNTYANVLSMNDKTGDSPVDSHEISYNKLLVETDVEQRIKDLNTAYPTRFADIYNNMNSLKDMWSKTGDNNDIVDYVKNIEDALTELAKETKTNGGSPADSTNSPVIALRKKLEDNLSNLRTALVNYKAAYANFIRATGNINETELTELLQDTNATNGLTKIQAIIDLIGTEKVGDTAATGMTKDVNDSDDNTMTDLHSLIEDYNTKWNSANAYVSPSDNNLITQADTAWSQAIAKYNQDVTSAQTTYTGTGEYGVNKGQPELNKFNKLTSGTQVENSNGLYQDGTRKLTNQASLIVPTYSAVSTENGATPTIGSNEAWTSYTNYDNSSNTYTSKSDKVVGEENDFEQLGIGSAAVDHESVNPATTDDNNTPDDPDDDVTTYAALTLGTLKQNMDSAKEILGTPKTVDAAATGKNKDYQDAVDARTGRDAAIAQATQAETDAKDAYEAVLTGTSSINIKINLAADEANLGWTYDHDTDNTTSADFYYNKVLGAGETSDKLIDSVYLDENTSSKTYKTLTFDLNVGLDSVQVTYDADQRNWTDTAVDANDNFKLKVKSPDSITAEDTLVWEDPNATPAATTYTVTVTFKDATGANVDTTADYVYTVASTSWAGTAPTGANKFCATNSENQDDWKDSVEAVLDTPDADGTATVYYKTV